MTVTSLIEHGRGLLILRNRGIGARLGPVVWERDVCPFLHFYFLEVDEGVGRRYIAHLIHSKN